MTSLEKKFGATAMNSKLDFLTKLKLLENNNNNLIVHVRIFEFPIFLLKIPQSIN